MVTFAPKASPENIRKRLIASSPYYFAERLPRFEIHSGMDDILTTPYHSKQLEQRMKDIGRSDSTLKFYYYEGKGHAYDDDDIVCKSLYQFAELFVGLSSDRGVSAVYTYMIAVITYDAPHRKTQDVVARLILSGYPDVHLVVVPWTDRKNLQPIFNHRPSNRVEVSIEDLCQRVKINFTRVQLDQLNEFFARKSFDHILISGAGILPADVSRNHKIINSHPGFLPNVKGLDALKWSIYQGHPIGVTTHYISDKADEGQLIERRVIPSYFEDSFHNIAYRVYESEIEMLVKAIALIESKQASFESLDDNRYPANKRMPHHLELIMIDRFEELRRRSKSMREGN